MRRWVRRFGAWYAFVLPALLLYAAFVLYPFLVTIYYSMTDWDGAQPQKNFIGSGQLSTHAGGSADVAFPYP